MYIRRNLGFLCVFLVILYGDGTTSSRGLGCTADGKTVKTLEPRISTSFQRGIVLTCFAPALHWGGIFHSAVYIGGYFEAGGLKHYKIRWRNQGQASSSGPSYGLYSSWGPSLKSTQVEPNPPPPQFHFLAHQIEMSLVFVKSTGTKEKRGKRRIYIRRYEHRSSPPTDQIF